jgi:hypothetical protein
MRLETPPLIWLNGKPLTLRSDYHTTATLTDNHKNKQTTTNKKGIIEHKKDDEGQP